MLGSDTYLRLSPSLSSTLLHADGAALAGDALATLERLGQTLTVCTCRRLFAQLQQGTLASADLTAFSRSLNLNNAIQQVVPQTKLILRGKLKFGALSE